MKPFTILGIDQSDYASRIVLQVIAPDAEKAIQQAEVQLNSLDDTPSKEPKNRLLGAAVFEGHLKAAGPFEPDLDGFTGIPGYYRSPGLLNESSAKTFPEFTVVFLDPATLEMGMRSGMNATPGNAEQQPELDFHLIAGVLSGSQRPVFWYQPKAERPGRFSTRDERIKAMCRYCSSYEELLGTDCRMPDYLSRPFPSKTA